MENIEQMVQEKGLTAPRVTKELISSKIESIDYVEHRTPVGAILRWAVLNMVNGFSIVGKPSASISPENDDEEIGKKVAYENAFNEAWALEGYVLANNLRNIK